MKYMRIAIIKLSTDTTKETNAFNHFEMQCKRYKKKILLHLLFKNFI